MASRVRAICLVPILGLGLLFSVTSGDNCPVYQDCHCSLSSLYCRPKCGPNIPKFAGSNKTVDYVSITGTRDIRRILPDTFQGLSTKHLTIEYTGINYIDCDAFKGIATGLNDLKLTDSYMESVPSCSLQHVTSITVLYLQRNHISNLARDAFSYVPHLQSLYLKSNEIELIELSTFNTLSKLEYLNLDENTLSHLEGYVFTELWHLRYLYLRGNKIKSVHPKAFDGLFSLAELYLSDNKISALDGTVFYPLVNIIELDLHTNEIQSLSDKILVKTRKLKILFLNNNQLVSLPYNIFQTTRTLRILHIESNHLSTLDHRLFSYTPELYNLSIHDNRIVNLEPGTFKGLALLRSLKLNDNHLVTIQRDVFRDDDSLLYLSIQRNKIRDLEPGCFRNLLSLWSVDLSENHLNKIQAGVFTNSSRIHYINLADNRISFIENGALESQQQSLQTLNLRSNRLTNKLWITLTPILTKFDKLDCLDLSHNPVGNLPAPVISSLRDYISLGLRNCSLTSTPIGEHSFLKLDLSANNLKHISNRLSLTSFSLNVSDTKLKSIFITLRKYGSEVIDAQQNEITSTIIDISLSSGPGYQYIGLFQLSKNLMADSLMLWIDNTYRFTYRFNIGVLDLSYNRFTKVTQYPLLFNSSLSVESDWYDRSIIQLNLSHNSITFVSPYAFLGLIENLDLSHNRIEVFDRLIPANISNSNFRTRYLNISNNRIHRITPEAIHGYEHIVRNINLAKNVLTEIQSLRNYLEQKSFEELNFSGNPLNCDCDSFWLRQDAVFYKLDYGRCDQPDNVKGYLSVCYPLNNCSPQQTTDISDHVLNLCKNDNTIIISDLKLIQSEAAGISSRVNVSWTRHGPGIITGYTLETAPRENSEKLVTSLVHPAAVYFILSDLEFEVAYNVCISAHMKHVTISEITCATLTLESKGDNSISARTKNVTFGEIKCATVTLGSTGDNIIISKSILIGISSALGLRVLCIVTMLVSYFIRRQKTFTSNSPNSVRSEMSNYPIHSNLSEIQNNPSNLNDNQNNLSSLSELQNNLTTPGNKSQNHDKRYANAVNVYRDGTNTYEITHIAHNENSPMDTSV